MHLKQMLQFVTSDSASNHHTHYKHHVQYAAQSRSDAPGPSKARAKSPKNTTSHPQTRQLSHGSSMRPAMGACAAERPMNISLQGKASITAQTKALRCFSLLVVCQAQPQGVGCKHPRARHLAPTNSTPHAPTVNLRTASCCFGTTCTTVKPVST